MEHLNRDECDANSISLYFVDWWSNMIGRTVANHARNGAEQSSPQTPEDAKVGSMDDLASKTLWQIILNSKTNCEDPCAIQFEEQILSKQLTKIELWNSPQHGR